ncbi:EXD3 isoform 9, partial [Pongo abelii]
MDSWCQPGFDIKDVASFWKHLVCDICQQLQRKGSTS